MSDYGDNEASVPGQTGFVGYLPVILLQRKWLVIVPFVICALAGLVTAFALTPVYRASATLLVESQQLPSGLVGAGNSDVIEKRISKIRQQVLSRPDLVELIRKNDLYRQEATAAPMASVLDVMRSATTITPVASEFTRDTGNGSNTVAFNLTFDYPDRAKAAVVAKDFVDRLVKLDASQTAEQAAGTVAFLEEEAKGLTGQISQLEGQIESIKAANGITLSGTGAMMLGGGAGYGAEIASLTRENNTLRAQLSSLNNASQTDPAIVAAEAQLANARAIYSESHPDVRLAELRLAQARRLAGRNTATAASAGAIQSQIAANESMISALNGAKARDESRASSMMAAQSRAPLVTEQIGQLQSRADQLRTSYQTVANNLMNARASVRMDNEKKGERLSVIDPPQVADGPLWPNRPLIIGGSLLAGLILGLVFAMVVEFLRRPIRGVGAVERITGAVPLVVVPTLGSTAANVRRSGIFSFLRNNRSAHTA